jgi:iron-containing alcohol dehydrogenase-like protein
MKDSSTHDTKLGVLHAGPTAIDQLPELVRAMGQGRALVLVAADTDGEARTYVERALADASMPARVVEISDGPGRDGEVDGIARILAQFAGGGLVSVGDSALIATGKAVATLASNPLRRPGQQPRTRPRAHIAVPTALGPAEEATSMVTLGPYAETFEDDRLLALAVVDERVFPETDPDTEHFKRLAVALAACTVIDDTATLRDSTLALSAVHHLVGADTRPVEVRQALTLATAGHPRWPSCPRCKAGTVLPATVLDGPSSPAQTCLQQAVARGLTVGAT